jgi:hypothetical protein
MNRLERFAKASWNLLKDSKNYSDKKIIEAFEEPKDLGDALTKSFQIKMAAAPFIFVLGTYIAITGGVLFGAYKGGEFVYHKVKDKIEYNKMIKSLEDIPKNMALPEGY